MFNSTPHSPLSYQIRPFTLEGKRWKWIKKGISLAIPPKEALTFFLFFERIHMKEANDQITPYHIYKERRIKEI
jgi:hypothetical protein